MNDSERVARAFIDTWERKDVDDMVAACTDDMVYQNVPTPPMHGREAFRAFMAVNMPRCERFESEILSIATTDNGDRVLTERRDTLVFNGNKVQVGVMGIFEVRDGKIAAWRDYLDVATYTADMRAAGVDSGPGMAEGY